jgi:hypothetical protein
MDNRRTARGIVRAHRQRSHGERPGLVPRAIRETDHSARVRAEIAGGVPRAVWRSPLARSGGVFVTENLLDSQLRARLCREACDLLASAIATEVEGPCVEEIRGGNPPRRFLSAAGGPVQDALYGSGWLSQILTGLCGIAVAPSGGRGTYTYYARAGDHLGLHRDVHGCDVALVSVLHDEGASDDGSGALRLYPARSIEPLSAIRREPQRGMATLRLRPGHTLIMLGGLVPHLVVPVQGGQMRTVSILCYRFAAVGAGCQPCQ